MPELPEVRALAERLEHELAGLDLMAFSALGFSGLKTVSPAPSDIVGSVLRHVSSQGKYLILDFGDQGRVLFHLGNSGRLDLERPPKQTKPRGSLARLNFDKTAVLVREYGSERRAGLWVLAPGEKGPLSNLGPEPFEPAFAELVLTGKDGRHLHTFLRDQRTVAGIGRGYSDDVLHRARLSPFATLTSLNAARREQLLRSIREVLSEALDNERQRTGGLSDSSLGDRFAIHRRSGEPCPNCKGRLERISYETNEVAYCPSCQTDGRVLADRRLSRLLR